MLNIVKREFKICFSMWIKWRVTRYGFDFTLKQHLISKTHSPPQNEVKFYQMSLMATAGVSILNLCECIRYFIYCDSICVTLYVFSRSVRIGFGRVRLFWRQIMFLCLRNEIKHFFFWKVIVFDFRVRPRTADLARNNISLSDSLLTYSKCHSIRYSKHQEAFNLHKCCVLEPFLFFISLFKREKWVVK